MSEDRPCRDRTEQRLKATEERFRIAQVAGGIGWFEWDLGTDAWEWTPHVAVLFGFDPETPRPTSHRCGDGLRNLHARQDGPYRQLESWSREDQRILIGRNSRSALLPILYRGRSPAGGSTNCANDSGAHWKIRGRRHPCPQ